MVEFNIRTLQFRRKSEIIRRVNFPINVSVNIEDAGFPLYCGYICVSQLAFKQSEGTLFVNVS